MARTKTKPIGRTPLKRRASETWLRQHLAGRALLARNILESGAEQGWGWATVRRAKSSIGAQSFKKGDEWWWFDPKTYTPIREPLGISKKTPSTPTLARVVVSSHALEEKDPAQVTLPIASPPLRREEPKHPAADFQHSRPPIETVPPVSVPLASPTTGPQKVLTTVNPPKPQTEPTKPVEPPKPRSIHIWDSSLAETRDALISSARFTDLYVMRADIRLRQEHLRNKGLLKEEAALNDLVSRINEAVEKKKKQESLE
jgi:hypothetical protein